MTYVGQNGQKVSGVKMASWDGEELAEGLERWLKARRDEKQGHYGHAYDTIDQLLDEARDCGAEGWFPWQRISGGSEDD